MSKLHVLLVRDEATTGITPTMLNLLIALVALIAGGISLALGIFLLRRMRASKNSRHELPTYESEKPTRSINNMGLMVTAPLTGKRTTSLVVQERLNLIENSSPPPSSPVPEIMITFPDEVDKLGRTQSGRVVVVKVGDHSVGLEPLRDEKLPPYQQDDADRFQSLDLERIGGLKEGVQERRFA